MLPSSQPSIQPTSRPSSRPSSQPNSHPTSKPSYQPTSTTSCKPSRIPTSQPHSIRVRHEEEFEQELEGDARGHVNQPILATSAEHLPAIATLVRRVGARNAIT